MNYVLGNFASSYQHLHKQNGYVISEKYELVIDNEKYELNTGDTYYGNRIIWLKY